MDAIPPEDEVTRAQREMHPKEDLSAYRGEWVLLRKGWLVAHDPDLAMLMQAPERRPGDGLMFVPLHPEHIWVM